MATEEGYNGWTNKPTWLVKLWIDNEQGSQEYWLTEAREDLRIQRNASRSADSFIEDDPERRAVYMLAKQLKEGFEEAANLGETTSGFFTDLFGWALAQVEWREVAESLIEDAKEVPV